MPFINQYRYVEFIYGKEKNRIMTSDPFSAMGESMQIEATNTAGKSMSIITILQAIVPLVDTNKTALEVFTNTHPLYMLIEWITEDNTRILTGIGLARRQVNFGEQDKRHDRTKLFDIVTFIVEYNKSNPFDFNNIEFQYEKNDRLYTKTIDETIEMFEKVPSAKSIGANFIRLYRKSYLKDYRDKLKEYGIYPEEWEDVIARLNQGESVLSEYFDKNKSTKLLMKNVLIPIVEENVNTTKGNDFIKGIQEDLATYREYILEHENELNEYENITALKEKIYELDNNISEAIRCEEKEALATQELSKLYNSVFEKMNELGDTVSSKRDYVQSLNDRISEISYQEESLKYSKDKNDIKETENQISELATNIINAEDERKENKRKLDIYELNQVKAELSGSKRDLAYQNEEKEKLNKTEAELTEKLNNIGYTLKLHYQNEIEKCNGEFTLNKNGGRLIENNLKDSEKRLEKLTLQEKADSNEISKLDFWFDSYQKEEIILINQIPKTGDYIENTLEGKKFKLNLLIDSMIKENEKNHAGKKNLKVLTSEKESEKNNLKHRVTKNSYDIDKNAGDIKLKNEKLETFNKEKNYILLLFEKFELRPEYLYQREEGINSIESFIKEREERRDKQKRKSAELRKEIDFLKGDTENLIPNGVKAEFERLGVSVINGMDWLNKHGLSFEEKKIIYEKNPLLIYSLIVTEKEYDKLKSTIIRINNTSPLPLMLKSQIDDNSEEAIFLNNIYENNGHKFMIFFDSDMLDEGVLAARIDELEEKFKQSEEAMQKLSADIDTLYLLKNRLTIFDYELVFESSITRKIEELNKNINDLQSENNSILQVKIPLLDDGISSCIRNVEELSKKIVEIEGEIKAICDFNTRYCSEYETKYSNRDVYISNRNKLDKEIRQLNHEIGNLRNQKETTVVNAIRIENRLKDFKNNLKTYLSYNNGNIIEVHADSLIGQYDSLSKESKADDIKRINKEIGKLITKISDLENREETLLDLIGENYITYTYLDKAKLDEEKQTIEKNITEYKIKEGNLKGALDVKRKNLKDLFDRIYDTYKKQPSEPASIIIMNYENERRKVKDIIDSNNFEIKKIERIITDLKTYYDKLEECSGMTNEKYADVSIDDVGSIFNRLKGNLLTTKEEFEKSKKALVTKQQELLPILQDDKKQIYDLLIGNMELKKKKEICNNIRLTTEAELDILKIRKQEMENDRLYIYNSIKDYVDEVLKGLRRLSDIAKSNGERLMKITIKDENINYKEIYNIIDNAADGSVIINNVVTTFYLLDIVAKIRRIKVDIVQYELYNKRMVNWDELSAMTTGAQKFCISFILLIVLMEYKRFDEKYLDRQSLGKVLLMDNPFGEISEGTLLKPVFELAKKLKVQIISYTHIQNPAIRDCFNKIYLLKVRKLTSGRELTELTKIKDTINESTESSKFFAETTMFDIIDLI